MICSLFFSLFFFSDFPSFFLICFLFVNFFFRISILKRAAMINKKKKKSIDLLSNLAAKSGVWANCSYWLESCYSQSLADWADRLVV